MTASLLMALVALLAGAAAVYLMLRKVRSEASVYRNRIAGTMLGGVALTLGGFAWALHSWSV